MGKTHSMIKGITSVYNTNFMVHHKFGLLVVNKYDSNEVFPIYYVMEVSTRDG